MTKKKSCKTMKNMLFGKKLKRKIIKVQIVVMVSHTFKSCQTLNCVLYGVTAPILIVFVQ